MDIEGERRKLRFLGKIKVMETGCWEWQAGRFQGKQYGMFYWGVVSGKEVMMQAHRAAWAIFRGDLPKARKLDGCVLHKCNNPPCVNPDHLYIGTHQDNANDRDAAGHTSRWDHRYNFKRGPELIAALKAAFSDGLNVREVCDKLGIGWQTVYRCRDQDQQLKALMAATKRGRYSRGAFKREAS